MTVNNPDSRQKKSDPSVGLHDHIMVRISSSSYLTWWGFRCPSLRYINTKLCQAQHTSIDPSNPTDSQTRQWNGPGTAHINYFLQEKMESALCIFQEIDIPLCLRGL